MDGSPRSIRRNRVSEVVVVAGGCAGEGVLAGHALGHVVANALAEAVVVVGGVVDGQEAAVFGVEDE